MLMQSHLLFPLFVNQTPLLIYNVFANRSFLLTFLLLSRQLSQCNPERNVQRSQQEMQAQTSLMTRNRKLLSQKIEAIFDQGTFKLILVILIVLT